MTRRLLLFLSLAAGLRADSEKEVEDLVASAISGLSEDSPGTFIAAFDPSMPDREKLRAWVVGLLSQGKITCSIEVEHSEGDDEARTLVLDWLLRIDYKEARPGYDRRQKAVTCKFRKIAKKWKIVSLDPLDFFMPAEG